MTDTALPIIRNVNPLGQVDLPLILREGEPFDEHGRGCLEAGEEFEVTAEQAAVLLQQRGNYEPVNKAATRIAADLDKPAEGDSTPAGDSSADTAQKPDGE